jgi:hypothetical protein
MLTVAYGSDGKRIHIDEYDKSKEKIEIRCAGGHSLIAKKGKKVVHHFAHAAGQLSSCDPWRGLMTHWHAQWQNIVLDQQNNIEVFIGIDGKSREDGEKIVHIADIIKPSENVNFPRPMIIEIQHSPMNLEIMREREAYYQHMIWIFDFTARIVKKGNHNKIAMIDGRLHYLSEKVDYVSVMTCSNPHGLIGTFVIVYSKTKYWFDSEATTFYDTGFCMLQLIHRLEKGFAFTKMISYEEFMKVNMPPINPKKLKEAAWFNDDLNLMDLAKLGLIPKPVDVISIMSVGCVGSTEKGVKTRLEILFPGDELGLMGFVLRPTIDYPNGIWCAGSFHTGLETPQVPIHNSIDIEREKMTDNMKVFIDAGMREMMDTALNRVNVQSKSNPAASETTYTALFIERMRRFLELGNDMILEIEKTHKKNTVIIFCNSHTYKLKDKFKMLGMLYRNPNKKSRKVKPLPDSKCLTTTHPYYHLDFSTLDKNLRDLHN